MAHPNHFGRVAMLYTMHRGVRGIRYRVGLPSTFSIEKRGGDQAHYVSAYASLFEKDGEPRISMVEAGVEFVPKGKDPNSGAWATFLNPAFGTTMRNGVRAPFQRGRHSPKQGQGARVSFELMLVKPDLGTFSVDGIPFNDGTFRPALPYNVNKGDAPEPIHEAFERGVNARIAIGYNDEGTPGVCVRDFSIEVTELYRKDKHGKFGWTAPISLMRSDETKVARFESGKITLNYGMPPRSAASDTPWRLGERSPTSPFASALPRRPSW